MPRATVAGMSSVRDQYERPNGHVIVDPDQPTTLYGLVPVLMEIWVAEPDPRSLRVEWTTPRGTRVFKLVGPELLSMASNTG